MMDWKYINSFVGIPFKLGGRDKTGIDCIGLVWKYLYEQGYQVELHKDCTVEWIKKAKFSEWKELVKSYGEPIEDNQLQENDIIYFAWKGEIHAGVYVGYNKYLHISSKTSSRLSRLNDAARKHIIAIMRPSKTQKKILPPAGREVAAGVAFVVGLVIGTVFSGFNVGVGIYVGTVLAGLTYSLWSPGPGNLESGGDLAKSPKYRFGGLRLTRSNELPVPLIYGLVRVSGNIIYSRLTADEQIVYQLIGLSEGEVESISDMKINGADISEFSGTSFTPYYGTATQEVDVRATSELVCYGLRHISYAACTWQVSDALRQIPSKVTVQVSGIKVEIYSGSAWTTAKSYSNNPAACIRDYLIRDREVGGCEFSKTININNSEFGEVYDYCNGSVSDGEGGTENRFELNYVIDTVRPIVDNLVEMLVSFGGYITITGATITLRVKKSQSAVHSFTMDNIKAGSFNYEYIPKDNQLNRIGIQYTDIDQEDTKPIAWVDDFSDQDENGVKEKIFPMYGIGRFSQAARLAWQILYDLKINPIMIKFQTDLTALHMEPGDIFNFSHDVPNWTEKPFLSFFVEEKENNEFQIQGIAYNSSVFNDSYGSGIMTYDYGAPPNIYGKPPDMEVFEVDSDGANLLFTWDRIIGKSDNPVHAYEIREGNDWTGATLVARVSADRAEYKTPIRSAGTRTFMSKARSQYGLYSTNVISDSITITKITGQNIILSEYAWPFLSSGVASSDGQLIWTTNYNSTYYRRAIGQKTATTWEDHETAGRSWDDLEAYNWDIPVVTDEQTFEFPEIDIGETHTAVPTNIIYDYTGTVGDITIEWKYSTTSPIAGGYATFIPGEYTYRYVRFRIKITCSDEDVPTHVNDLILRVDALDVTERGNDVSLTSPGGATITFDQLFGDTPAITVSTQGTSAYYPIVTAKSSSGFTVKLYDDTGTEQSGVIDWLARGWWILP